MKSARLAIVFLTFSAACSFAPPRESPEDLAATIVQETQLARETSSAVRASKVTDAPEPTDTRVPPSRTPRPPTTTPSPLPQGPVSLTDDFSADSGIWSGCEVCEISNGQLHIGPFPVSGAFQTQWNMCDACGMVSTFELTIETAFIDGPSERGYGLVIGLNEDRFLTYEITPWQTIDFWQYEYDKDEWSWLNGQFVSIGSKST